MSAAPPAAPRLPARPRWPERTRADSRPPPPAAVLCREQAVKVWSERAQFEALGVGLVCVIHEWLDREVAAFAPAYWGGRLLLDADRAFNAAVHGGTVKKGSLLDLLNPFSRCAAGAGSRPRVEARRQHPSSVQHWMPAGEPAAPGVPAAAPECNTGCQLTPCFKPLPSTPPLLRLSPLAGRTRT